VYFANENGVYLTDGAKVISITENKHGGISFFWREEVMKGYFPELGHVCAMGLYQDMYLFLTVTRLDATPPLPVTEQLLCFLPSQAWIRLGPKLAADMYATSLAGTNTAGTNNAISNDIYLAQPFGTGATSCRIVKAAGILSPTVANVNDADGSPVLPQWTTRAYIGGGFGQKRYGYGHLSYQMNSIDTPTLTVAINPTIEETGNFIEATEGSPLAKTTAGTKRKRFRIFKDAQGLSFQITQTAASEQTEIYALEFESGQFLQAEGP
jgi:hypothetical protein